MDILKNKIEELYNAGYTKASELIELLVNMFPDFSRAEIEDKVSQWLSAKENKKNSKWIRRLDELDEVVQHSLSCSKETEERQL